MSAWTTTLRRLGSDAPADPLGHGKDYFGRAPPAPQRTGVVPCPIRPPGCCFFGHDQDLDGSGAADWCAVTIATYGEHAENAARALSTLVRDDRIPTVAASVDQMLHCREAVVDALRQRLFDMGHDDWYPPPRHHLAARIAKSALRGLDARLATLVDNIAFALPTLSFDERRSPIDILGTASTDSTVEAWRQAAVELLTASQTLAAANEKPWVSDGGAGWWVMRDVAVALEAVLVLDARLDEVGLLGDHHIPNFAMGLEEKRLVLSQAARVATWWATNAAPDQATPRRSPAASNVVYPVSLVAVPEDLAPAQARLARFLRPLVAHDSAFVGDPEISAECARQVTASQLYLCRAFAHAAATNPKTRGFSAFFEERAEVLGAVQPQISHLVDVIAHEPDMRRFWQQSELTTAVARMEDRDLRIRLQPAQMLELARTTHEVVHNLGKGLRRELLRGSSNLRDAHPRHDAGPVRVPRRSRLEATLSDLVHLRAPAEPAALFTDPLQRAALRKTLDLTPTASRTPTPFPAARGDVYGAPAF